MRDKVIHIWGGGDVFFDSTEELQESARQTRRLGTLWAGDFVAVSNSDRSS